MSGEELVCLFQFKHIFDSLCPEKDSYLESPEKDSFLERDNMYVLDIP